MLNYLRNKLLREIQERKNQALKKSHVKYWSSVRFFSMDINPKESFAKSKAKSESEENVNIFCLNFGIPKFL